MTRSITDDLEPEVLPITERAPLAIRTTALIAAVVVPLVVAAALWLLPWARATETAAWPTAEGLAMAPVILGGLSLIALLYRDFLRAFVVDHRGVKVVRGLELGRGFAATWCIPVAATFFPAMAGGSIETTLGVAGAWAAVVVYSLERDRRLAPRRRLRWTDPVLEQLRRRPWGAVGCMVGAGAVLALAGVFDSAADLQDGLSTLGLAAMLSAAIPYFGVWDAAHGDDGVEGAFESGIEIGALALSAVLLAIARRDGGALGLAAGLIGALLLGATGEYLRRRMRARRIAALVEAGHAAQLAATYGWRA